MPSHDGNHSGGKGPDPGSLPSVVPQDRNFSRRISFFHLAAPDGSQRRPHATAQEESPCSSARGDNGDGGRGAPERAGRGRPEAGRLYRPLAIAAVDRGLASGIPNDFFAA